MAIGTNFRPSQNLKVIIGIEGTVGSGALLGGDSYYELPLLEAPTINNDQLELSEGSEQANIFIPNINSQRQRYDTQMWEISFSFLGTTGSFQPMHWVNSDNTLATLPAGYTPPVTVHGGTNTLALLQSAVIWVAGAEYDSVTSPDQQWSGMICKSMSVSHSIDANAGFPVVSMTFVTGYKVTPSNDVFLGNGEAGAITWGYLNDPCRHWTDITHDTGVSRVGDVTNANCDVRAYGCNISFDRDVSRIGYASASDFRPYGYSLGAWKVTGDATFKYDSNFANIAGAFRSDAESGFSFKNGVNFGLALQGKVSGVSQDTGSPEIRSNVQFAGSANPASSDVFAEVNLS